ncbi:MAG: OprD family outer membrane porin [Emticicia sp.]
MKKNILLLILLFIKQTFTQAQQAKQDSFSLKKVFSGGKIKGSVRQFSMFTDNHSGLSDYYALAIGAGLNYETKRWRNIQFNFGGFFVHDLASSDFTKTDPITKTISRYDIGLFDILELNNQFISRVENLNVKYFHRKSTIIFGKQTLRTPLVNPQDGRMNSSMMEGIYADFNEIKNLHLEGGWLYRSSPRSTFKWLSIGHSIGAYPMGLNIDGKKGNYYENLNSKGLFILGGNYSFNQSSKLTAWNYFIENISNTAMLQWNQDIDRKTHKIKYGLQFFRQSAVNEGGSPDPAKTYMAAKSKSMIFGAMVGINKKQSSWTLNYTRITKDGRFQFPREWGRDPFFTFLPRERNEGLGGVHAVSSTFSKNITSKNLIFDVGLGKYILPDVKDFRLNKYGMPSYTQLNIGLKYTPKGIIEGIDIQALAVKKWNNGQLYADEKYRINKVDMTNYNVVLNYNF